MFRIMYIPVTFKNVILSLVSDNFMVYMVCLIPSIAFFGSIYTMIGVSLNNIEEFFKPREFAQKSFFEKVKVVVCPLIIIATIFIMVWLCLFTSRKMKEYKRRQANMENESLMDSAHQNSFIEDAGNLERLT
jgi:hypothetical protein